MSSHTRSDETGEILDQGTRGSNGAERPGERVARQLDLVKQVADPRRRVLLRHVLHQQRLGEGPLDGQRRVERGIGILEDDLDIGG